MEVWEVYTSAGKVIKHEVCMLGLGAGLMLGRVLQRCFVRLDIVV